MLCFKTQVADRLGVSPSNVLNCIIWGNHSSTQYPDVNHANVIINDDNIPVVEAVKNDNWIQGEFTKVIFFKLCSQSRFKQHY